MSAGNSACRQTKSSRLIRPTGLLENLTGALQPRAKGVNEGHSVSYGVKMERGGTAASDIRLA